MSRLHLALVAALLVSGPTYAVANPTDEPDFVYEPIAEDLASDPFERFNRLSLRLNLGLGRAVIGPVSAGLGWVFPGPVGRGLRRAVSNLSEPVVLVNHLLQLRGREAAATTSRFLVNTTVGLLGLRDPATGWGLERRETTFGDTLARYRVPAGPYLVLPVLGPTTARGGAGSMTDLFVRPETLLLGVGGAVVAVSADAVSKHHASAELFAQLELSSVDLYVAVRTAYLLQEQAGQSQEGAERPDPILETDGDEIASLEPSTPPGG